MATATEGSLINDELNALRYAFEELLRVRASLAVKRNKVRRFRRADRRIRRAHDAVQKQAQDLAVELHSMGISSMELKSMMDNAAELDAQQA